jgi:hypothetical protein
MKRLQIYLTDDQFRKVRDLAYKKVVTMSHVIRWCIDAYQEKTTTQFQYEISNEDDQEIANDPKYKYIFDPEIRKFLKEIKKSEKV